MAAGMEQALLDAQRAGISVVFRDETPKDFVFEIAPLPPLPVIDVLALKRTQFERANPNQPWYSRFRKREQRRKW